jgi:integrase
LELARIGQGLLFRRVTGNGKEVGPERLTDKQAARLVKRAGLASSADIDERYVQRQLGHMSVEMTRRYQRRRERFRKRAQLMKPAQMAKESVSDFLVRFPVSGAVPKQARMVYSY